MRYINQKIEYCDKKNKIKTKTNTKNKDRHCYYISKRFFDEIKNCIYGNGIIDYWNNNLGDVDALKNHREWTIRNNLWCFNSGCNKTANTLSKHNNNADITDYRVNLKLCRACRIVRYCSRKCQKIHWKAQHKKQCKHLQRLWYK